MPPAAKRRRIAAVATKGASVVPALHQGIQSFGRISKSQRLAQATGKGIALGKDTLTEGCDVATGLRSNGTKRKLTTLDEIAVNGEADLSLPPPLPAICDKSVETIPTPACISLSTPSLFYLQPATPRKKPAVRPRTTNTPTQGAQSCLESLALASSSSPIRSVPLPEADITLSTCPASDERPSPLREPNVELPPELLDLINLQSSFLTALSLHYAHHGCLTPADLRILRLSIERSWGKRRINTDDYRKILGILHAEDPLEASGRGPKGQSRLSLSDYGNGKICVEISEPLKTHGAHRRPLDEESMKDLFTNNLNRLWQQHTKSVHDPPNTEAFLSQLPLANIRICSSVAKISPLLAKGQQRLRDLKAGALKAQKSNLSILKPNKPITQSPKALINRSQTLLDRILAKQLQHASLPSGPSPALLARKSALQRLEEIIPVIEILTSSGSKTQNTNRGEVQTFSFTLPTLVQHLQNSLRNPISRDEVERCVGLLAEEVAPGWIRARRVGKLVGLTVDRGGVVAREEMRLRVERALDG
ncbi:MAG: hypothetical protein LQ347_005315 [Umbilicaria vellea]|nr:MAG: hypothetical protein LQ347_005315 [Umbilicaria vellea]